MLKLLAEHIIDPQTEVHFAFHETAKYMAGTPHCHDFYEVFCVEAGSVVHVTGMERIRLGKGNLVFIRPNDVHTYEDWQACRLFNFAFSAGMMRALSEYMDLENLQALLTSGTPPQVCIAPHEADLIVGRMRRLSELPASQKPLLRAEARLLAADLLVRYFAFGRWVEEGKKEWLDWFEDEMSRPENFTVGLERMKQMIPFSYEHFCRLVKKRYNKTPSAWVNELRIQYAASLLNHTDLSILEIAAQSGFDNASYFYRVFKRHYRLAPAKYRQQQRRTVIP